MLLTHGAVIAVVDGERLQLYRNSGDEAHPALASVPAPTLHGHNKAGGARHVSSSANPAEKQLAEDAYAAAVTDWLNAQVFARAVEKLVVIAPPRTLGEMRRRYSRALESALICEVAKELTAHTARDVMHALRAQRP